MNKKKFKTISEQKKHLMENKNILDNSKIIDVLKERTYVSIINTYKEFFYTSIDNENNHTYSSPVDFNNYIKLASIDDSIANRLQLYIGYFERRLKQIIAYEYSNYLANTRQDPTCTNYVNEIKEIIDLIKLEENSETYEQINPLLNDLGLINLNQKYFRNGFLGIMNGVELDKVTKYRITLLEKILFYNFSNSNDIIKHYIDKQEYIPFWIIVHKLSLGELLGLCSMFNGSLRTHIHKSFNSADSSIRYRGKETHDFFLKLDTLKHIRNTVNHYEPILIKFKTFTSDKLLAALKLLKDNYDNSIIANHNDLDLSTIADTSSNESVINLFKMLLNFL